MLKLKIGEKFSVLLNNQLLPTLYKGVLQGYYYSNFAQYENALFLYIKRPRAKKVDRIVLIENESFFIFKGYTFNQNFRKEVIKNNDKVTHTLLHRWTYNDLKGNKNLIFSHRYGEKFQNIQNNFERFSDLTADYMMYNDISPKDAQESTNYINYIKELIKNYNVNSLLKEIKENNFCILESCFKKAISYNW